MTSESIRTGAWYSKADGAITVSELLVVAFGRCGVIIFEAFIVP
jgi:hypothetical protein